MGGLVSRVKVSPAQHTKTNPKMHRKVTSLAEASKTFWVAAALHAPNSQRGSST